MEHKNIDKTSLIEFPTRFSIKVFGDTNDSFIQTVKTIINQFVEVKDQIAWLERESRDKNYLAITVTIMAKDKGQLDNIYMALTSSKAVKMAL